MIFGCSGSPNPTASGTLRPSTSISPSGATGPTTTVSPPSRAQGPAKLSQTGKPKESNSDLDQRFGNSVRDYIRDSWGDWAKGDAIGQCLIGNMEILTQESKEGVIEHGIEESFEKLTGEHLGSLSTAWDLCQSGASADTMPSKYGTSQEPEPKVSVPTPVPIVNFESTTVNKPFPANLEAQFQNAIDRTFDEYTEKAGISVAVYKEGYLWRYAKGDASSSAPMTVRTPMLIRSSSKSFTAGLALKQIDDSLYSLSDTLATVLSGNDVYESLNESVINSAVTIEELLTMTSGIQQIEEYNDDYDALQVSLDWKPGDLLQLVTIDFKTPGHYNYSNTNTMLLGIIAEHTGGQNLNELYKTELFDPLDIVALLLPRDGAPANTARPHGEGWGSSEFGDILESSYLKDEWYLATGRTTWNAAGIITTPENMSKWAYELFSASGSVLSPKARATLLGSFTGPLIQIGAVDQQYGYHSTKREMVLSGMTISAYGNPGSGGGYISDFYYSPELDLSLSIVVNSHKEARTREEAKGAVTHSGLNEIAWQLFDAYAKR